MNFVPGHRKSRKTVPVIYVSVEGIREELYFKSLAERNAGFSIRVFQSKRKNATGVVESCADRMKRCSSEDIGIAVFDVDENTEDDVTEAVRLAKDSNVSIAITNPSIEFWILLHFEKTTHLVTTESIMERLDKLVNGGYTKTRNINDQLTPRIVRASERAKSIFEEDDPIAVFKTCPSTNVHWAVEMILEKKNRARIEHK
jgi:hypothetical protein